MRLRAPSVASLRSNTESVLDYQEMASLYDYLAKIILLGPSGTGKSCILQRFIKGEWRVLGSQTIGVEFSSKIVKVGQGENQRNMKLQLWDTAGQERFRSLTRGYYRGSAGVLLVFDTTNRASFEKLPYFLADIRALISSTVSIVVFANKEDLVDDALDDYDLDPSNVVSRSEAMEFCMANGDIPLIYGSALTGSMINEAFMKLASMIITKVQLGVIEPDDMDSGVQYGDLPRWDATVQRRKRGGMASNIIKLVAGGSGSGYGGSGGAGSASGSGSGSGYDRSQNGSYFSGCC